ncbi:hypothetical protein ACFQ5D_24310 [Paenibacillus farraposensis]|uniref:Uncharacterized protein n=1 Tax=Paenibacillus farraposensis TaxID=2807095 RepID=A0ABW4DK70_9BACL
MKTIRYRKTILLVGAYFVSALLTQCFVNGSLELTKIVFGAGTFLLIMLTAEAFFRKEGHEKRFK